MAVMQFERCAVRGGAILYDPRWSGNAPELLFDREHWRRQGRLQELHGGRGGIAILGHGRGDLALRHYRRGGWAARLSADRYLYTGEPCVRSFRELRLHALLVERGLPVPVPVAALYRRRAAAYEADLITVMIPDAQSLASRLVAGTVPLPAWFAVGACLRRFHRAGFDHADLNAHNILVAAGDAVHLVDLDRGRLRSPGAWQRGNLRRLQRSLLKVTRALPGRYGAPEWTQLLRGYRADAAGADPAP
jgi:3-deoxy-D-manno-octulosonic acid kinase